MLPTPLVVLGLAATALASSGVNDAGAHNAPAPEPAATPTPSEPSTPASLYFGDVDGDGLEDALAIDPEGRVALLHNEGKGEFLDITLPGGLAGIEGATCALFADFDGDGALDLFLGSSEKRLWRNLGGASFQSIDAGVEHDLVDLAASAVDFDGDGRLDLRAHTEAVDLLYRNSGAVQFEAVRIPNVFPGGLAGAEVAGPAADFETDAVDRKDAELDEQGASPSPSRRRLGRWIRARNAAAAAAGSSASNLSAGTSLSTTPVGNLPLAGQPTLICAGTIVDQGSGQCIGASSSPTIGRLYPLSTNLSVGANGHVGIGTTSPYGKLHVVGVNGTVFQVFDFPAPPPGADRLVAAFDGGAGIPPQVRFAGAPAGFIDIGQNAAGSFVIEGSDAPRLTVMHSGNVGIGTSAPETALNVKDGSVWVNGATGGNLPPSAGRGVRVWHEGALDVPVIQATDWSTLAGIDLLIQPDGGNVGIGTLTPTKKLDVVGNATISGAVGIGTATPTSALTVVAPNANNISALSENGSVPAGIHVGRTAQELAMGIAAATSNWFAGSAAGDGALRVADSTKRILLGAGIAAPTLAVTSTSVGVGTTSPAAPLHSRRSNAATDDPVALFEIENCGQPCGQPAWTEAARLWNRNSNGRAGLGFMVDSAATLNTVPQVYIGTGDAGDANDFRVATRVGSTLTDRLTVDGASGLVSVKQQLEIRGGADIVERFESSCGALEPGTVVSIDPEHPGKLACASGAYDTKVAGVVSGAGGVQPGLCLSQDGMLDGDTPVAMNGRVYVKCTASNGAIKPGDRLTTAELAGHAMKVSDEQRSIGAVIGKAMTSLETGEGLVLVLVNLQ